MQPGLANRLRVGVKVKVRVRVPPRDVQGQEQDNITRVASHNRRTSVRVRVGLIGVADEAGSNESNIETLGLGSGSVCGSELAAVKDTCRVPPGTRLAVCASRYLRRVGTWSRVLVRVRTRDRD